VPYLVVRSGSHTSTYTVKVDICIDLMVIDVITKAKLIITMPWPLKVTLGGGHTHGALKAL